MARFMGRHHRVEPDIFFVRGVSSQQGRQEDRPAVGADRRARRLLARLLRLGQRLDRHIGAAEGLREQFQRPRDLAERHAAHCLLDRGQRLLRFQRKVGPPAIRAELQDLHPALEPLFESGRRVGRLAQQRDDFRTPAHIIDGSFRIPLGDQGSIANHFQPPFVGREASQQRRRLGQKLDRQLRRAVGQDRPDIDHSRASRAGHVGQDRRARAEKLQRADVIRLAQAVLRDQLHAECDPRADQLERQRLRHGGHLPDQLDPQHVLDLRQFRAGLGPGAEIGGRQHGQQFGRAAEKFQRDVRIVFGQFQCQRQRSSAHRRLQQSQHQRTVFPIFQCCRS